MSTGTYARRTEVSSDRSRVEIEKTLMRFGADEFQYGRTATVAAIGFALSARRIRFVLPLPDRRAKEFTHTPTGKVRTEPAAEAEYEQSVRTKWRALLLILKAKLVAIQDGVSTVESEFLAHTLLPDGRTVEEWLEPQLAQVYARGEMPPLLPGPSGRDER